jgi:hypothetical protein
MTSWTEGSCSWAWQQRKDPMDSSISVRSFGGKIEIECLIITSCTLSQ